MKTKISRISRRTVSMVLALLMMVSVLGFGSLITANAATVPNGTTFYLDVTNFTGGTYGNNSNYFMSLSGNNSLTANSSNTSGAGSYKPNKDNSWVQMTKYIGNIYKGTTTAQNTNGRVSFWTVNENGYNDVWDVSCSLGNSYTSGKTLFTINSGSTDHGDRHASCFSGTWSTFSVDSAIAAPPANVLAGTEYMFYIESYSGYPDLVNTSCQTPSTYGYTYISDGKALVRVAQTSLSSYNRITNNKSGNWNGQSNQSTYISGMTQGGADIWDKSNNGHNNPVNGATTLSSSSIVSGTASITLGTQCSAAKSSIGADLYYMYYLDGTRVSGSTKAASTSSQSFTLTTSSLSVGEHTLKTIMVDGNGMYYIGDTDTITVTNPKYNVTIGTVNNGSITSDKATAESGETVTLTLSPSTGYNPVAPTITKAGGGTVTPTKVSNTSYTFTMPSQAVTVTATFPKKTYTVTYNKGNNGTGTNTTDTKTYGVALTLKDAIFTREGYTQTGWSTSDGGAKAYDLGGSYTTNADTTLYPHWTQNTHRVTRTAPTNGTLQLSKTSSTSGFGTSTLTVAEGAKYWVKATPNTGYKISALNVGGSAVAAAAGSTSAYTYEGTMGTSNVATSVTYTKQTFNVKKTETGGTGTITIGDTTLTGSNQSKDYGSYTITVTAPSGYNVDSITSPSGSWSGIGTGTATLTGYTLSADLNVTVTYAAAGTCAITAKKNNSSGATLSSETMNIGDRITVCAVGNSFHSSGDFTVNNSNSDAVAISSTSVAKDGTFTVTAKKAGTATITISCTADSASTSFDITVSDTSISMTTTDASIDVGGTVTREATGSTIGGQATGTISYSTSSSNITVDSTTGLVTGVSPTASAQTVTATYTVTCGGQTTTKTKTYNVTVTAPTVNITSANNADFGGTVLLTASSSGATTTPTYSFSASNSKVSIDGTTLTAGTSSGTVTITVTARYNASYSKTATQTFTVNAPTISSFAYSTSNMSVGETRGVGNMSTTHPSSISGKWSRNFTSSDTAVATVNPSTGVITAVTPGTFTVTVTILYDGVSTGVSSTTGTLTVATPTITMADITIAKGDKQTLSATTSNPSGLTMAYELASAVTGVSVSGNKITVASDCAASSATIVAKAKNSAGTVVATKNNVAVTIQAPSMTIEDVESDGSTKLYTTVGTNITKKVSTNFDGNYSFEYSKTGVATAAISNGTLTIAPQAKGSTTITVTHTKAAAQIAAASAKKGITKGKLSTGAAGDVEATQTFTVNVSEADTNQFITVATSWESAYIYYWGSSPANANKHLQMTKVGTDNEGRNVYAINVGTDTFSKINGIIFTPGNNWDGQTNNIENSGDGNNKLSNDGTKFNSFYLTGTTSGNDSRPDVKGYTTTITLPQISTPSTLEVAVDDTSTITPTVVNEVTPAATLFVSDDTDVATVGASTGVVTGVNSGSAGVTAYAFAPKPHAEWQSWITDTTTKDVIAGSATTSVSVTDTPRTINFSNTLKTTSGGNYDAAGASAAGTISASYTTGGSGSGSGGSSGGTASSYYVHYNKTGSDNPSNYSTHVNMIEYNNKYYATIDNASSNTNVYFNINTNSSSSTPNSYVLYGNGYTATPQGGVTAFNIQNYGSNDKCYVWANQSNYTKLYVILDTTNKNLTVTTTDPGVTLGGGSSGGSSSEPTPVAINDGDTVPNGTAVTFSVDSVNAGYRFVGWYDTAGQKVSTENQTTFTSDPIRSNYTVYARFEKGVNVTFKDYNNNVIKSETFTFDGEVPATPANDPTREGYTFIGWSSDGGTTKIATANLPAVSGTSAITYIAQYTEVNYSVNSLVYVTEDGTVFNNATNSQAAGHQLSVTNTDGSAISDPAHMHHPATVKLTATVSPEYKLLGIYRWHDGCTGAQEEIDCITGADGSMTCNSYSLTTENEPGYYFVAKYEKIHFVTLYNTYEYKNGDYIFKASPPRQVKVGTGATAITYTYAAGTASQRGQDHYATSSGTTGTYYEGNKIPVEIGQQVQLTYSGLPSSDAIKGVFFNNSIRYTHELEGDNLYLNGEPNTGGTYIDPSDHSKGYQHGDDEWGTSVNPYTYLPATTLYADANFYTGDTASTISAQTYIATVDNSEHTVTWTPTGDNLNIDLEIGTKYRIHINDNDWNGIEVTNNTFNPEGYYYPGETINGDTGIEVCLDTSDSTKHFSFTDVNSVKKKTGDNTYVDDTSVELVKSNGNYYIRGTDADNKDMPAYDLYVTIGVKEEYKMYLDNFVVADDIGKRLALTETYSKNNSSAPYGDRIGTITAVVNDAGSTHIETDLPDSAFTYEQAQSGSSTNTHWVHNGDSWNPQYKGTNTDGSFVEAGKTVTYTFSFNTYNDTDYGTMYSFLGWFEGNISNGTITPNYNKKLSGKTTFTYTPKKDTVIVAAGTRDIYLGGNFTSDGAYTATSANQTWSTGRIKMDFDPTWVNGDDKGRYYYVFDSVTDNTEYKFRCYDTSGGSDTTNLNVWKTWSGSDYADDNDDIFYGRHQYADADGKSHGQFVYKTNTNNWSLSDNTASDHDSTKNHQALGYAEPVTVYFYAYDGGIEVKSEYQWSKAYVSKGRGIDVIAPNASGDAKYNVPSVSVANKTVGNKDVVVADQTFGSEAVKVCTVKEKDGQIVVTADPEANNLGHVDVQAFLVYNIETKKSEAVKAIIDNEDGTYKANITIPQNSKIYVVPIYKFIDSYIRSQNLESHTVYVRTEDIDKDEWGGLVSMYSWGTDARYNSGGWPGQLMIPSDDGETFYAPLTFTAGGLAGVTFCNYDFNNFIHNYKTNSVSTVDYSGSGDHFYQTYDYREPISIIENLSAGVYEDEDMDLTFELKPGNKTENPNTTSGGSNEYNKASSFEYLTDRSGNNRVDLNGDKIDGNPTETYRIVCNYTPAYKTGGSKTYDFTDGSRDGSTTHNEYSIDWTVYEANGNATTVSGVLSAAYIDIHKSEMLTHIASKMIDAGLPVSGRAVKIAYENPGTWDKAIRYSGQWYSDSVNTLVDAKVRVGIYSDGAWLPSDTNAPGYGTATVSCTSIDTLKGENLEQEFSAGYSKAHVIKSRGTNGQVTLSVDTGTNFLGWYRQTVDGEFEPVGSNYKNTSISPSFNDDITYYAFYSASASYRFAYTGRDGSTKYYTVKGSDLTEGELAANGTLNTTERAADITSKLSGISGIKVFNNTLGYTLSNPVSSPYTLTYNATQTANVYNVGIYTDVNVNLGTVSYQFGEGAVDLYRLEVGSKPANQNPTLTPPSGKVFIGWKKYNAKDKVAVGDYLSTQINFGYNVTETMDIVACYGTESEREAARTDSWRAYIDKNVITQELSSATSGKIYNDNIIAFRNGIATNTPLPLDGTKECGIVILAQTNSATTTEQNEFDTRGQSNLLAYANNFIKNGTTSGMMNSKYGEAYAFKIKVNPTTNLSAFNRIDLCQILDYAKFSGGKFKVMSYYYDGSVAPSSGSYASAYVCSEVTSKTYTVG